ncbi:MAG TPA: penicillin-binding protein, partial [Candidatus Portnoybacteria bacterium]|nr:penicillin-binding protein [Candidatus Portnoybacteria bacterium]
MSHRKIHQKKKKKTFFRKVVALFFWLVILGIITVSAVFLYFYRELPSPNRLNKITFSQSTRIYDRTGKVLLYEIYGNKGKSTYINSNQISDYLKKATVATEDAQFYSHFGIDFRGILRAIYYDLIKHRIVQGGSTITQQFVKNYYLSPKRTIVRKIKEAILAIELEMIYSKDKILTMYLNQISYGSNTQGIEAASEMFFGKKAKDLDLAQASILAALPKAPTYYSPYGSHWKELKWRQKYILDRMVKLGFISREQAEQAKKEELKFKRPIQKIKAPHFVMYIKEYLEKKYGLSYLEKSGLKIYTTLDWPLQEIAEEVVANGVRKDKKYNAHNGSLVAIDPKTGQILAMVGSKDYFIHSEPKGCQPGKNCYFEPSVNVSLAPRQPGSSFKPIVYAQAFSAGYTPSTVLYDVLTDFSINHQKSYIPKNYDLKAHGPVTARQALAWSLNIPAVKILYLAGKDKVIDLAHQMGFTTLQHPERLGLALVLGGGEVKLLDEVGAYAVFAQEGIKHPVAKILKIVDHSGQVLESWQDSPKRVLSAQVARQI